MADIGQQIGLKILSNWHVWLINRPARFDYCGTVADKSAELIVHARHGWPIYRPLDYQPLKDKNLCLSILGLVHKSGNYIFWFSALKIVCIHLPCTVDRGGASILSPGNMSTNEKSPCQTVHIEKKRHARWRFVQIISMPPEGYKK